MYGSKRPAKGFTLIELLVVIAVITVLAGVLFPVISQVRWRAKMTKCQSNLHNLHLAVVQYYESEGRGAWYPPWLTYLGDPRRDEEPELKRIAPGYIDDPKAFICPADETEGQEGNRHSGWNWEKASKQTEYDEFQNPDADWHPDWDFTRDEAGEDKVPCSYLYEFCSERCEWAHRDAIDAGYAPQSDPAADDSMRAPELEWEHYDGSGWRAGGWPDVPNKEDFLRVADTNHDNSVSWAEIKSMCRDGASISAGGKMFRLPKMEGRLPLIRCYWHVGGPIVDRESTAVLNVNVGGDMSMGHFMWQRDLGMY